MAAPITNAIAAYTSAGKMTAAGSLPGNAAQGGSFADMLKDAAGDVVSALKTGEQQSLQAVAGKADLTAVTQAVNNAEVALQAVIAVRDRVISAYNDISKMPI
jgi:flagellar hook-basal body complex protein FliE